MAAEDVIARLIVQGQAQFGRAMAQASGQAKTAGTETEQVGRKSAASAKGLLRAAAAAGALYKGFNFLKGSVGVAGDLAKSTAAFSRASGLDKATSQAWIVVAQQRGIQTKQLQLAMATLGRNMGALGGSTKASSKMFRQLGVDQAALIKLPMSQRIGVIADAFSKLPDGVNKAALAQRLFGRAGQSLLPLLNSGAKGLNDQLDAAKALVPYNEGAADATFQLAKNQRELKMATMGIKVAFGNALIPVLAGVAKVFTPVISSVAELMQKSPAFRIVIYGLTAAFAALAVAVIAATLPLTGTMAIIAGVVVGIAALAAGFATAYTKVTWFRNAVNAVWTFIKSNWQLLLTLIAGPIGAAVALVITHWSTLRNATVAAFNAVKNTIAAAINTIKGIFNTLRGAANTAVNAVKTAFNGMVSFISSIPRRIGKFASGMFQAIPRAAQQAAQWAWNQFNWLINQIKRLPAMIGQFLGSLGNQIKDAVMSAVPGPLRRFLATGGIIAAQTGLAASRGTTAVVGERGPEIAQFPSGTRITPLPPPQLMPSQLLAGAGGGGRQIVTQVYLDRRQIAEAIGDYSADQQAAR